MPLFEYTALEQQSGKRQPGTIDAPSRDMAFEKLRQEGLMPLSVVPVKEPTNVEDILARFQDIKPQTMVYFSRQLATMIDSNMSPLMSLTTLEEQEENPKFREILSQVISRVEAGVPMWEAMQEHPMAFDRLYVAMVRSGEEAGNLHGALKELATQLEKSARIRKAVKAATTYPKVVGIFAFLIVSGLMMTIVPKFGALFEKTIKETQTPKPGQPLPDASLPTLTQVMVDISRLLYPQGDKNLLWAGNVALRFVILIAAVIAIRKIIKRVLMKPGPRRKWDGFKLNAPMKIGPLVQKVIVARFSRTFASLLSAGVPAVEALNIVADTAGNHIVSEAVMNAREQMLAGANIAEPLARSGAFPTIVTRMIQVGEETGQLEMMLLKIAEFFEDEVDQAINGLTSIIEPLMILFVGSLVGLIIIAIYLPMFAIYDKIGTGIMIPLIPEIARWIFLHLRRIQPATS